MQPELSSQICSLHQVLFETRQKLEFLNQIYKLRASLIEELLHPQFSKRSCSSEKQTKTNFSSDSTTWTREGIPHPLSTESLSESVPPLPPLPANEPAVAANGAFDFTQLDLLIQKAKKVRNVEEPKKMKKEDSDRKNQKECCSKEKISEPSSGVSKSDRTKQPLVKPRIQPALSAATPKSTYQSSYSRRPFLLQKRRGVKIQSYSLPSIHFEERDTADMDPLPTGVPPRKQFHEDTQHNSAPNDTTSKLARPPHITDNKEVSLSFPPPYAPPALPSELAGALRDLKRAQLELARLLRTDHTKLLSPGRELINQFDTLHRGEETAEDRLQFAYKLHSKIEAGSMPSEVKSFFLSSLQPHMTASADASRAFVYPCFHCTEVSACSTDGIQVARSYLLRELKLCSLLSHCYPGSLLSGSSLMNRERLPCVDLDQFLQLQLLIIDVFSLSVKKDVLAVCMKAVPTLELDRAEDRQALKIIVNMLDSSNIISFYLATDK